MEHHLLPREYGIEILRVEVGSTLHGTGLPGAEDHDSMGIYMEWPESTIGWDDRAHYIWRSAEERDGRDARSQPDDTDLTMYSLRRWMDLALKGNPSVLQLLWAPDDKIESISPEGSELRENREWFVSKLAGAAFLGYMQQQRQRMLGQRGAAGRIRKTPNGEVDWKYAMHMLRLGFQGEEFLRSGTITMPMPQHIGDFLRQVRRGDWALEYVMQSAENLERAVERALLTGAAPALPMRAAAEHFLIDRTRRLWDGRRGGWTPQDRSRGLDKVCWQ